MNYRAIALTFGIIAGSFIGLAAAILSLSSFIDSPESLITPIALAFIIVFQLAVGGFCGWIYDEFFGE